MAEAIGRGEFDERISRCDERYSNNSDNIKQNTRAIGELANLLTKLAAMQENTIKTQVDQESRIRALEKKPTIWLDRILYFLIGGGIAIALAMLFPGK